MSGLLRNTKHFREESEAVLKALERNKIKTVGDFCRAKPSFILYLFNTYQSTKFKSFHQVQTFKEKFLSELSPPIQPSSIVAAAKTKISTQVQDLDRILGGHGFESGQIFEIFGVAGSGKSQLCFHMAFVVAAYCRENVLYFDTKNDFSPERIRQMYEARIRNGGSSENEDASSKMAINGQSIKEVMSRIRVARAHSIDRLLDYLYDIPNSPAGAGSDDDDGSSSSSSLLTKDYLANVRLLVVDNVASAFMPMLGERNFPKIAAQISLIRRRLQQLAHNYNLVVMVTNNASINRQQQLPEGGGGAVIKPALGKLFSQVADVRLKVSHAAAKTSFGSREICAESLRRRHPNSQKTEAPQTNNSTPTCKVEICDSGLC